MWLNWSWMWYEHHHFSKLPRELEYTPKAEKQNWRMTKSYVEKKWLKQLCLWRENKWGLLIYFIFADLCSLFLHIGYIVLKSKTKVKMKLNCSVLCQVTSVVSNFSATPRIVVHQAPLSMQFSTEEYWSQLPCPPPGDLPDTGIELASLMSPVLVGGFFATRATWEAQKLD